MSVNELLHPKHVQRIQGPEEIHVVDRRRVRTGFTDNLQLPIVGLWRRTTIVDEGREDALPRGGCLVSYLRYLGSVKDRYFKEGERRLYGPAQASHDGVLPTSSATHYVLASRQQSVIILF